MTQFIAHKIQEQDSYQVQTVKEHLTSTAELCRLFASEINCGDLGRLVGLMHDIGKYSDDFQRKIKNDLNIRVDHATAGGQLAKERYGIWGELLAYCIMGHHGGMPDGGTKADTGDDATLNGRQKRKVKAYSAYEQEIELPDKIESPVMRPMGKMGFTMAALLKMLHSCLVDSDFLDTEHFMSCGQASRGGYENITSLHDKFFRQISLLPKDNAPINMKRNEILKKCVEKAESGNHLYTLTVPTGGGKTLSSMAFALKHARYHHMKRIIYVIPYTSIIEQNAKVFKSILGEDSVLEHHSSFDFSDDENDILDRQKLSSENWDIPIVVTTNVQFFESFFSNKPSRCRKIHNMANSVIILDEAQMLPMEYLKPCLYMLSELVYHFNSTVVLCSATQPAVSSYLPKEITTQELCGDEERLYQFFKRTSIVHKGNMTNEQLSAMLCEQEQALCIVNTKKHALLLFQMLKGEYCYHLSTAMCPAHRKLTLKQIKSHLEKGEPCIVISTQLIEAGVDVDFPAVYRAEAGLDSIIQSAGRCNREGKAANREVYVFEPEPQYVQHMPNSLKLPVQITKSIFRNFKDVTSPEAVRTYFQELYQSRGEGLDSQGIVKDFEEAGQDFNFPFKEVAGRFKLIEETARPVIVPFKAALAERESEVDVLIESLRYSGHYRGILRSLQTYTVNLYEHQFAELFGAGKLEAVKEEVFLLRDMEYYDDKTGINLSVESGIGIFY